MTYILLIPIFAILDRWCGGGMGWRSTFRGRPIYYLLPLILIGWFLDWRVGAILTAWCVWREPAWKLFGGSLAPITDAEINGTIFRHCLIFSAMLVCIGSPLIVWALAFVLLSVWVFAATFLAVYNGSCAERGRDVNDKVEAYRGACFGFVAWAIIMIQGNFA